MSDQSNTDTGHRPKKSIKVTALFNGTVIDHLDGGSALKVIEALDIGMEGPATIGLNFESKKHRTKDLIKIENKELTQEEINKIALISPGATCSIIRNFKVVDKIRPELPNRVEKLVKCNNPSCVTNQYEIPTVFTVLERDPIKLRCYYCERSFKKEEIQFN